MTPDPLYTIHWITGDTDRNLTAAGVRRIARENDAEWVGGRIVEIKTGRKVGSVLRTDDY